MFISNHWHKKTIANSIQIYIKHIRTQQGAAVGGKRRVQLPDSLVDEAALHSAGLLLFLTKKIVFGQLSACIYGHINWRKNMNGFSIIHSDLFYLSLLVWCKLSAWQHWKHNCLPFYCRCWCCCIMYIIVIVRNATYSLLLKSIASWEMHSARKC